MEPCYFCIDLKSFYASVECVERGLDPMRARLVVADPERGEHTICLAVSPALKKLGIPGRCRIYEIPKNISYIQAPPRMQLYLDYSAEIYGVYLKYIAREDIHVYSVDEVFLDVAPYLHMYRLSPRQLAERIRGDVLKITGIPAACGIGTNLYLAKIALDIVAKKSPDFLGELNEEQFQKTLWDHRPLTDFWRIGPGISARLRSRGLETMRQVAAAPPELLRELLGVDGDILKDHARGWEPTRIADIKAYHSQRRSFCSGQVLPRDYAVVQGEVVLREMADELCSQMAENGLETQSVTLRLYAGDRSAPPMHGSQRLMRRTASRREVVEAFVRLYRRLVSPSVLLRRLYLTVNDLLPEGSEQLSLFENSDTSIREKNEMQTLLQIRQRFGKNAVLRGTDFLEGATRRERNAQIGGHKSGLQRHLDGETYEEKRAR